MAKWNPDNLPSQKGRQVVITGGSSGIGYHTALALCVAGADVTIAVRNMAKGQRVADDIMSTHPSGTIQCMPLDVSSMASTRAFASSWKEKGLLIDTLILKCRHFQCAHTRGDRRGLRAAVGDELFRTFPIDQSARGRPTQVAGVTYHCSGKPGTQTHASMSGRFAIGTKL